MSSSFRPFAFTSAFVLIAAGFSVPLSAQSPHEATLDQVPVNNLRPPAHGMTESMGGQLGMWEPANPNPPHFVLEPPRPRPSAMSQHGAHHDMMADEVIMEGEYEVGSNYQDEAVNAQTPASHVSKHKDKFKNQFLHGDKQAAPVGIPNANRIPVWKTPYSYGHFGASRNRQWTKHRGHQDSYLQWTLR